MRSIEELSRLDVNDNFKYENSSDVTHVDVNLNVDISQQDSRNRENNKNRDESKKDNRQLSHERSSIFDNKKDSRSANQINVTSKSKSIDANRALSRRTMSNIEFAIKRVTSSITLSARSTQSDKKNAIVATIREKSKSNVRRWIVKIEIKTTIFTRSYCSRVC